MKFDGNSIDTIFGLATSPGRSAIHVIRVSGSQAHSLLGSQFRLPGSKTPWNPNQCEGLRIHKRWTQYLEILDLEGKVLDDALVLFFLAPHSYTGEDTLEIQCHGNPIVSASLMSLLIRLGLREALPGEFTQRAYLNGKMDLIQAEAVGLLISSQTQAGLMLARNSHNGVLSEATRQIREKWIQALAFLEAQIDFSDDEIGPIAIDTIRAPIMDAVQGLHQLLVSFHSGARALQGLRVVLLGNPNAGKSSLFNGLLKEDKAIVTEIPGTTRDVLEASFCVGQRDFVLVDTAGIRSSSDIVEQLGIARALEQGKKADVLCVLVPCEALDSSQALTEKARRSLSIVAEKLPGLAETDVAIVMVFSKVDLLGEDKANPEYLAQVSQQLNHPSVFVTVNHLSPLVEALSQIYDSKIGSMLDQKSPILFSQRQKETIQRSIEIAESVLILLDSQDYPEKIASQLGLCLSTLSEILGTVDIDEVYQEIFSKFCIGK
jgi:tRNA modification GTPase